MLLRLPETDTAIRGIWLAVADNERLVADRALHANGYLPTETTLHLSSISLIVTHVELCVVDVLTRATDTLARDVPRGLKGYLMKGARSEIDRRWDSRIGWICTISGVHWKNEPWYTEWLGYVETRNAWQHGRGSLTRKQRGDEECAKKIREVGLELVGTTIRSKAQDVRRCAQSAERVLTELDTLFGDTIRPVSLVERK